MVEFSMKKKKVSYEERIREIVLLLNEKGSVSLEDLFKRWTLDPLYIRRLMQMATMKYSYIEYDPELDILKIKERKEEKK